MLTKMQKVLIAGPQQEKELVLSKLQNFGLTEIRPYQGGAFATDSRHIDTSYADKISFILKTLDKEEKIVASQKIEIPKTTFSPQEAIEELPKLIEEQRNLAEEKVRLRNRIEFLEPWGEFSLSEFKEIEEKSGLVFQFWDASQKVTDEIEAELNEKYKDELISTIVVNQDVDRIYFITFSKNPIKIEKAIEINYDKDLLELKATLKENEEKQKKIKNEIYSFLSLKDKIYKLYLQELNKINFHKAASGTVLELENKIFILQSWVPVEHLEKLKQLFSDMPVSVFEVEADEKEAPPTLLKNNKFIETGQDLVEIYDFPSRNDWDPTTWVFLSFTIFFSMIVADGGYGLTLFLMMLFFKIKIKNPKPAIKRFFNLSLWLSGATTLYGFASGSFYGLQLDAQGFAVMQPVKEFLKSIRLFDGGSNKMMLVAILIGMFHINLSLILKGLKSIVDDRDFLTPIINILWIATIWVFYFWYSNNSNPQKVEFANQMKQILTVELVLLFVLYGISAKSFNPLKIVFSGFGGLYNSVQFFSDILSYIRIFALGLSGALLAQTFNNIAFDVWGNGMIGHIFAPLIFIMGHLLNILLCIMGGVIHGLRLNFLEWYRWNFEGGGKPFKPFRNLLSENNTDN